MKVSRKWLQTYFENELPSTAELADASTFHAFEVEESEGDLLDLKVLPDRAAYALSHRGIAREFSAILNTPLAHDPLREEVPVYPTTEELVVSIDDDAKCARYSAALVRGVRIGPSPAWLKEALESVGQRSINNVVDATNYVMLNLGQPLHAFDAHKLAYEGAYSLKVRDAEEGETITTLTGEEYTLPASVLVIADGHRGNVVGIAGIKGGKSAEITPDTTDIIIESANFDGTLVRRAAQRLKLFTDASSRFQNRISAELAQYGMRDVLTLIQDVAGGTLVGVSEARSRLPQEKLTPVSTTLAQINNRLGSRLESHEVGHVFDLLGLSYIEEGETFIVTPPFERQDINIPEDLSEEVGRIVGYDRIASVSLSPFSNTPDQRRYRGIERIKDLLVARGFTEISTPSFSVTGDIMLANPLDKTKPALRASLTGNMREALLRAGTQAPKVLGPVSDIRLFEIGTVFTNENEYLSLVLGQELGSGGNYPATLIADTVRALQAECEGVWPDPEKLSLPGLYEIHLEPSGVNLESLGDGYEPTRTAIGAFRPFSLYPFALRDIAVWVPGGVSEEEVSRLIAMEAGELLVRIDQFDRFEKEGRTSYAFRLVFESNDHTLSDTDLTPCMERVTTALNARTGWEVR